MINRDRLLNQFLDLCRVNTPARQEKVLVDRIEAHLDELGFECVRDNAHHLSGGDTGNLVVTLPGNVAGATPIFFSSHFDTVEPNPGVHIVIDDGVVKTDGKSILGADDKGGLAPIL